MQVMAVFLLTMPRAVGEIHHIREHGVGKLRGIFDSSAYQWSDRFLQDQVHFACGPVVENNNSKFLL